MLISCTNKQIIQSWEKEAILVNFFWTLNKGKEEYIKRQSGIILQGIIYQDEGKTPKVYESKKAKKT